METDRYYDNYMRNIYRKLRDEEIEKMNRQKEEKRIQDSIAAAEAIAAADSLAVADTLSVVDVVADAVADSTANAVSAPDSVATVAIPKDSVTARRPLITAPDEVRVKDTLVAVKEETTAQEVSKDKKLTRAEKRALRKAEREQRRAERKALRERRRAERKAAREAAKAAREAARAAKKKPVVPEQTGLPDSE